MPARYTTRWQEFSEWWYSDTFERQAADSGYTVVGLVSPRLLWKLRAAAGCLGENVGMQGGSWNDKTPDLIRFMRRRYTMGVLCAIIRTGSSLQGTKVER
jgi:hypothetical protein